MKTALRLLVISAVASLAGCTCERGEDSSSGSLTESEKQGKKTFYMPRYNAFRSLDPVKQFDSSSSDIIQNIYDRLFEYHYLKRPYQLVPSLLEKMPEKQADNMTYIFELKKGVYFNDNDCFPNGKGRELEASDVVYSLKRFADSNSNIKSYSLLAGFIEGMDSFRELSKKQGKSFDIEKNSITGVEVLSKYNFKIKFVLDNPVALYPFAMTQLSIVAREGVKKYGKEFDRNPVGTGAFYIKDYDRRGDLVLAKNKNYHGKYPVEGEQGDKEKGLLDDAGKSIPFVDEVVMPLIEEAQPAILSFQKGKIDFVRFDRDSFSKFTSMENGKLTLKGDFKDKFVPFAAKGLNVDYLRFNMKDPTVGGLGDKKKALRRAIAYALDVPGFLDLIYKGRGQPLKTIVPLPIYGSENYVKSDFFGYDPKKAKELLVKAGYPNGKGLPELTVEYRAASPLIRQQWEYHRAKLADVGIRAKASFQTFSTFLKKTDSGNFQIAAEGWVADYPDPENFFALMYGPNESPGPNHGFYKNEKYDKVFESMRFMKNGSERLKKIEEMNEILKDDLPVIYLYSVMRTGMRHKWLKNVKRNVLVHPPLRFVDIDLEIKKQGIR